MNLRNTLIGISAFVLLGGIVYFGADKKEEAVRIGVLLPLSGSFANLGEDVKNGLELAREDIKKEKGIDIELIVEDSAANPKTAVPAATKLLNVDKIDVIVTGPGSSANLAVVPLLEESKTVFIAISSTPKLNTAGRHVIKANHDVDAEAKLMAKILKDRGAARVAVLYDTASDTLTTGKNVFTARFEAEGGSVVSEGYDSKGTLDFKTQLTKIRAAKPDALYIFAIEKVAGPLIKQARSIGITQDIFGFSGLESEEFIKGAGETAEGVMFTGLPFTCDGTELMRGYCKKYEEKFGRKAIAYGAYGYDVLFTIAETIDREGRLDKEAVIKAFEGTTKEGVTGLFMFNADGNIVIETFPLRAVKNGTFAPVR